MLEQDSTLIAVIEMSQSTWLVAAVVPGFKRPPLKARVAATHVMGPPRSLATATEYAEAAERAWRGGMGSGMRQAAASAQEGAP